MADIPRQQVALWALAIVAVGLIGARYLAQEQTGPPRAAGSVRHVKVDTRASGSAYVHVTGAVRRPGVYRVPMWARLDLALRRAGGPARVADLEGVNLAAKVADGQQVIVPRRVAAASGAAATADGGAGASPAPPVSLNTATLEQLDQLEGVGPTTAQKILDGRREHGGFASIDDLNQISGIGPKRFQALQDKVRM
jgi:competence protein ComEA